MKYTVDFSLKPNGTFSVTDIEATCELRAKTFAIENAKQCGYTVSDFKKIKVKEVK